MVNLKKKIHSSLAILAVLFFFPVNFIFSAVKAPLEGRKILIDPGHGTIDPRGRIINTGRKTNNGYREHKLNLEVSQKLRDYLTKLGAEVFMTRTSYDYWREGVSTPEDNKARGYFANEIGADAYLAIHCDWHPKRKFNGITTYYYSKNSRRLGSLIQNNLIKNLGARDRGLVRDSFSVLDAAQMPAVLVEIGYLSNDEEARKLLSPNYQDKIVKALSQALLSFFTTN